MDARFRQVENVRHAHDRSGQPTSAGVAGRHPVPAVRGARSSAGGHQHLPRRGVRGPGQPDIPAEGVAGQVGQDPRRSQFAVRQEPEILFPNRTLQTVLTVRDNDDDGPPRTSDPLRNRDFRTRLLLTIIYFFRRLIAADNKFNRRHT